MLDIIKKVHREHQLTTLIISHDVGVIGDLADRMAVMYAGRIVEEGPTASVLADPMHPYTRGLLDSIPSSTDAGERLTPIVGSPPNLLALPSGCAFHPRCPFAIGICRTDVPPLRQPAGFLPGHEAACHRTEEVLADV